MNNESRLKRLAWCAAATCIAVAIWFLTPPLAWAFFYAWIIVEALDIGVFMVLMCSVLYFFGRWIVRENIIIVIAFAGIAGIIISWVSMYVQGVLLWVEIGCKGPTLKNLIRIMLENFMCTPIFIVHAAMRGALPLAAFIVIVYRYLPNSVGALRKAIQKN